MRNKEKCITRAKESERGKEKKKTKHSFRTIFTGLRERERDEYERVDLSLSVLDRPCLRSHSHLTKDSLHHRPPSCALSSTASSLFGIDRDIHEDIRPIEDTSIIRYLQVCSREIDITKEESYTIECYISINSI